MAHWWQDRVVYQIYPRSFQDSNGDGIGDIPGIIARLPDIARLGAGIIWLSPVYVSPDADNGYDIADYRNIDPRYGSLADMDRLIAEAHKHDIKIIMDLVINHTSDEHEWFRRSRAGEAPYRDYYIWQPPRFPRNDPAAARLRGTKKDLPNNWMSFFMEDPWTFDEARGEYYLHLFHRKQPDLNYRCPEVIEEVKQILRFWLDRGIAGFRGDVINVIWKHSLSSAKKRPGAPLPGMEHYLNQEKMHEILRELRRDVFDHYDCFTVGETVMVNPHEAALLTGTERRELDMLFYFNHLQVDRRVERYIPKRFRAEKLLGVLSAWQTALPWNALYLENHDQPRIVSHYGANKGVAIIGDFWERSAKLLAALEFTLRGTPFLYQGQEIGMTNFDFSGFAEVNDVETLNVNRLLKKYGVPERLRWKWLRESSRDNARTPVQWSSGPGAGFTTGTPWLGINGNYRRINYESQRDREDSVLGFYRMMIRLRAESETLKYGEFRSLGARGSVIAYERHGADGTVRVALNFSRKRGKPPRAFTAGMEHAVFRIAASNTGRGAFSARPGDETLAPWEATVLVVEKEAEES